MALIKCPECSKEVSDKAEVCPTCAFPLMKHLDSQVREEVKVKDHQAVPLKEPEMPEQQSKVRSGRNGLGLVLVGILVLLGVALFGIMHERESGKKMSTAELLTQAKTEIENRLSSGDTDQVKTLLECIPSDAPEYKEAQVLLGRIDKRQKEIQTQLTKSKDGAVGVQLTPVGKRVHQEHPDWSEEDCNTIGRKKIRVGMTTEQVRTAWGKPYRVNRTSTASGVNEQWVMREDASTCVYFDDGVCTTIQNQH
ncbi:hypothetical protein L4X63_11975 [Geomonas sp. Red32]|uniref:hypothetical protein n=1 Tax=Geomonas sp. Red32 TaxID=2912856 RepID=UPI00202CB0F4|nr:hypothetical protein [Geomonas sp. Red32]MCM0082307.1 hypothetical protein [Geomonas sp. Red32]